MEITKENFEECFPDMEKKILECDFCSIDCELSGITNFKDLNSFDTPRSRYEKMKKNDQKYLILQFGLCVFKLKDGQSTEYEATAYNCFLFPRSQNSKYSEDVSFSALNSSIEFLSSQNFDFNKVFSQGIGFMSKDHEEKVRSRLEKAISDRKTPKDLLYPSNSNNKEVNDNINKIMTQIDEFYANETESKMEIKFTDFLLRVFIEKNIKQKYMNKLKYEYKFLENKERLMYLKRVDASQEQKSELDVLDEEIGFSKLIWLLSKSQKMIIGHNMLTDIMQICRQFFSSPLPDSYDDFKSMANSLFPKILDTKYMANIAPLKELINTSVLGDMDKLLDKEPFTAASASSSVECANYSTNADEKLHEAGYDAFITGRSYIRMHSYLKKFNTSKNLLDYYLNKIFLMKSFDLTFIDLKNKQEDLKRDNVFYIEFPAYWEQQNLYDLFSPYGSIFIAWINDTSAFVAIQNPDSIKKAAGQLVGLSGREYRVYFYSTYQNQFNKIKNNSVNSQNNNNVKTSVNEKRKSSPKSTPPQTPSQQQSDTDQSGSESLKKDFKKKKLSVEPMEVISATGAI
jgi:poly(A)-specific ribonuclease